MPPRSTIIPTIPCPITRANHRWIHTKMLWQLIFNNRISIPIMTFCWHFRANICRFWMILNLFIRRKLLKSWKMVLSKWQFRQRRHQIIIVIKYNRLGQLRNGGSGTNLNLRSISSIPKTTNSTIEKLLPIDLPRQLCHRAPTILINIIQLISPDRLFLKNGTLNYIACQTSLDCISRPLYHFCL